MRWNSKWIPHHCGLVNAASFFLADTSLHVRLHCGWRLVNNSLHSPLFRRCSWRHSPIMCLLWPTGVKLVRLGMEALIGVNVRAYQLSFMALFFIGRGCWPVSWETLSRSKGTTVNRLLTKLKLVILRRHQPCSWLPIVTRNKVLHEIGIRLWVVYEFFSLLLLCHSLLIPTRFDNTRSHARTDSLWIVSI